MWKKLGLKCITQGPIPYSLLPTPYSLLPNSANNCLGSGMSQI
ncbi:hypothetical protein [Moorena producens]|nr:hypothetical protein [Moorena producens]